MAVKLLKQDDKQTWRPCWYGACAVDGKRSVFNTGVKWQGAPPASGSMRDKGDEDFEKSREKAEVELVKYRDEARRKGNASHLVERLIEAKTGHAVKHVKIAELAVRWRNLGREADPSPVYIQACDALFNRFGAFMRERNPATVFLYQVSPEDAAAFAMACRDTLASATARSQIQRLRSAFTRFLPTGVLNPFNELVRKSTNGDGDAIHRRPFTPGEIQSLLDTARDDAFMYPLIVTAACTGMRRGDVCRLQWSAVDFDAGMLAVKTSKSGAKVEIPMFGPLREVLDARKNNGSPFVFPEAVAMLAENQGGLTWRFKKIVATALDTQPPATEGPEPVDPAEIEAEALEAILTNVRPGGRRDRMLDVMRRYAAGQSYRDIERETGVSRPMLCGDFQAIQDMIGRPFIRGAHKSTDCKRAIARVTREARAQGQKSASVRDWHALRATWVTLALTANVPMELVRRVTGHATVDVVLRHYFRPGREEFKAALVGALPAVLTGVPVGSGQLTVGSEQRQGAVAGHVPGGKVASKDAKRENDAEAQALSPAEELAGLAGKLAAGTASEADRARFRELAAGV